jgi:hypothetical protein
VDYENNPRLEEVCQRFEIFEEGRGNGVPSQDKPYQAAFPRILWNFLRAFALRFQCGNLRFFARGGGSHLDRFLSSCGSIIDEMVCGSGVVGHTGVS